MRVLSRALGQATRLLRGAATVPPEAVTDWTQQARAKMKRIMEVARQRGEAAAERLQTTYRALLEVTTTVVARARRVQEVVTAQSTVASRRIAQTLAQFLPRVEQVLTQTTRRVLQGEQVPASEKLVSLFEPDTAIIRKGKPGKPTEFGRVLWLDEVEGGIISRYAVLDGNPDRKSPGASEPDPSPPTVWPAADAADRGPRAPFRGQRAVCDDPRRHGGRPAQARQEVGQAARVRTPSVVSRAGATGGPALKGGSVA